MIADVCAHVSLSLFTDFEKYPVLKPAPRHEKEIDTLVDQLIARGGALKTLRLASPQ